MAEHDHTEARERMGTGAEALAEQDAAAAAAGTLYRVRRSYDGAYLRGIYSPVGDGYAVLRWVPRGIRCEASAWPYRQAGQIATAMIALAGDAGIEIEPVAG